MTAKCNPLSLTSLRRSLSRTSRKTPKLTNAIHRRVVKWKDLAAPRPCAIASTTCNYCYDLPQISPEKTPSSGQSGHIFMKKFINIPLMSRKIHFFEWTAIPANRMQRYPIQARTTRRRHPNTGQSHLSRQATLEGRGGGASRMCAFILTSILGQTPSDFSWLKQGVLRSPSWIKQFPLRSP